MVFWSLKNVNTKFSLKKKRITFWGEIKSCVIMLFIRHRLILEPRVVDVKLLYLNGKLENPES